MTSIGILIFDGVPLFDVAAVQAAFLALPRFRCHLVSTELRPLRGAGGIRLLPECVLPPDGDLDALVLAGGRPPQHDATLLAWIARRAADTRAIAAIGDGRQLLERAEAPELRGRRDCAKVLTSESGTDAISLGLQLRAQLGGAARPEARSSRWICDESALRPAAAGVFPAA